MGDQPETQVFHVFVQQRIVEQQAGIAKRALQLAAIAAQFLRRGQGFR